MSVDISISKYRKPTKEELLNIRFREPYYEKDRSMEEYYDYIVMTEPDTELAGYLQKMHAGVPIQVLDEVVDYDRYYKSIGFSADDIRNKRIRFQSLSGGISTYTNGEKEISVLDETYRAYLIHQKIDVIAAYAVTLLDSADCNPYFSTRESADRLRQYYPQYADSSFIPVTNTMLARIEIPLLIFERNRGKCLMHIG